MYKQIKSYAHLFISAKLRGRGVNTKNSKCYTNLNGKSKNTIRNFQSSQTFS